MPGYLKQATAAQSRALGPFIDDTDFITPATGLTIANTDIKLVVNGGASANKNSGGGTHRVNGVYGVTFDATDTATVGELDVSVLVAGALVVFDKFFVIEEAVYDALFAASAPGYLQPTTAGRTLDVSAGGEAGLDWANIGSKTTANDLTATTIATTQKVDVDTIKTNPVANGGTITFPTNATVASTTNITAGTVTTATNVTTVNGLAANVITATAIADNAITAAKIADGAIDAATFAANAITSTVLANDCITDAKVAADVTIASVTGAVGSVTGNVGGNVAGSVASVTGNVGGNITGTIGGLTAAALKDFFDTDSGTTYASAVAGSVVKEIADNAGGASLTVQQIVDGVWDEPLADHQDAGTTGEAINQLDAPINEAVWGTATADFTTAGTFGKAVGDTKTETAAIKAKTDSLTFTVANQIDANVLDWKSAVAPAMTGDAFARLGAPAGASVSADIAAVKSDTAAILVDTGTTLDGKVDAIKAKTDALTFTEAGVVDANIQRVNDVELQGDGAATPWGPV
jgi:hypothetical protein